MKPFKKSCFKAGARSSLLSRAQVAEIIPELPFDLEMHWLETTGDLDQKTSLRDLGSTDFFTKELDDLLLKGVIRLAIHSAKDLPDPIPYGLVVAVVTEGKDPRDALVLRDSLFPGALIATSSQRREEAVRALLADVQFRDLRGTIHQRLKQLDEGIADGVVIAEAALIRLNLTHLNRIYLPGATTPLQGKLAVVCREDDHEMRDLLSCVKFSI